MKDHRPSHVHCWFYLRNVDKLGLITLFNFDRIIRGLLHHRVWSCVIWIKFPPTDIILVLDIDFFSFLELWIRVFTIIPFLVIRMLSLGILKSFLSIFFQALTLVKTIWVFSDKEIKRRKSSNRMNRIIIFRDDLCHHNGPTLFCSRPFKTECS